MGTQDKESNEAQDLKGKVKGGAGTASLWVTPAPTGGRAHSRRVGMNGA